MASGNRADRRREYLAKSEEAEKQAIQSRDEVSRAHWERIAEEYRKLAAET